MCSRQVKQHDYALHRAPLALLRERLQFIQLCGRVLLKYPTTARSQEHTLVIGGFARLLS